MVGRSRSAAMRTTFAKISAERDVVFLHDAATGVDDEVVRSQQEDVRLKRASAPAAGRASLGEI